MTATIGGFLMAVYIGGLFSWVIFRALSGRIAMHHEPSLTAQAIILGAIFLITLFIYIGG